MEFTSESRIYNRILFRTQIGISLIIALFGYFCLVHGSQNSDPTINSGCPDYADPQCLKCNIEGCIKCPILLIVDNRRCTDTCPSGYIDQWSSNPDFMGRVCISSGLSGPILAAVTGLIAGFLVCLALLIIAVVLVKRKRRRKSIKDKLINENHIDRSDFLRQLDEMRPYSEYILGMLNDTRRQVRKLYLSGEIDAANSYRPIVRDLAKLLILLNRPIELIPSPPHDWNRIYTWAERALQRYKPQVGQLIDFFQTSNDPRFDSYKQSTFRSTTTTTSTTDSTNSSRRPYNHNHHHHYNNQYHQYQPQSQKQQVQIFGSLISLHEFDEPRSSDPFGSSFNNTVTGNLIATDLNSSSLWLEDEFFKLGFRPQDEITTEL